MTTDEQPIRIDPVDGGFAFSFDLHAHPTDGQRKRGTFGRFEIACDEPEAIGGTDTAPPPLAYFAASVAF
ncbi:MAG: hypothetical protein AAGA90_09595 [Actinomycetota bacterium]